MKQLITRKGKQFEKEMREVKYDSNINIRIASSTIEELKRIAEKYGMKWNTMVREVLEDYVEREK